MSRKYNGAVIEYGINDEEGRLIDERVTFFTCKEEYNSFVARNGGNCTWNDVPKTRSKLIKMAENE